MTCDGRGDDDVPPSSSRSRAGAEDIIESDEDAAATPAIETHASSEARERFYERRSRAEMQQHTSSALSDKRGCSEGQDRSVTAAAVVRDLDERIDCKVNQRGGLSLPPSDAGGGSSESSRAPARRNYVTQESSESADSRSRYLERKEREKRSQAGASDVGAGRRSDAETGNELPGGGRTLAAATPGDRSLTMTAGVEVGAANTLEGTDESTHGDDDLTDATAGGEQDAQASAVPGAVPMVGPGRTSGAESTTDSSPGDSDGSAVLSTTEHSAFAIPTAEVVDDSELERENRRLATEIEELRGQVARPVPSSNVIAQRLNSQAQLINRPRGVPAEDEDGSTSKSLWEKMRRYASDWRVIVAVALVAAAVTIVALAAAGRFSRGNESSSDASDIASTQTPKRGSTLYSVSCETTADCEEKLQPGSVCLELIRNGSEETQKERRVEKYCTNPFASGCLNRMLGEEGTNGSSTGDENFPLRVCNSDDKDVSWDGNCIPTSSMEVRIAPGDWDTTIFTSWIFQILLSETLGVPVTIETGEGGGALSFYDPDPNALAFPTKVYNWDALREAHRVEDCASTPNECAHFMPEVWSGQESKWMELQALEEIEHFWSGVEVELSWYIPKFVGQMDSSLLSSNGMSGESNRKKLADTFKRLTTWLDYCREVSSTDAAATRWPSDPDEDGKYFLQDVYKGHFRATEENNCDKNPSTCTGHIVDAVCEWSTYTESQLYWNGIALRSNGPLEHNGAYSYASMIEIWSASNATGSPVVMWWWKPDKLVQNYDGGPNEFYPVALPEPTYRCTRSRVNMEDRCSESIEDRWGLEVGSCDYDEQKPKKIISKGLEETAQSAYDVFRLVQVTELELEDILEAWIRRGGTSGYEAREAVCGWVAENVDLLQRYIHVP